MDSHCDIMPLLKKKKYDQRNKINNSLQIFLLKILFLFGTVITFFV